MSGHEQSPTEKNMECGSNLLGQSVGLSLPGWRHAIRPQKAAICGRFCQLVPTDPEAHAAALFEAHRLDCEGRNWTYLPYGPFGSAEEYRYWMQENATGTDPLFFTILRLPDLKPVGLAAFLRIDPRNGTIEVGHLQYSPLLQRTPSATEAMCLMMREAFEWGYRRCEWKCNALNEPSRVAAQRLGFSFEGLFLNAAVVKGCNRDTAWYSVIDSEWPAISKAHTDWLAPENFDEAGRQHVRLTELTSPLLRHRVIMNGQPPTKGRVVDIPDGGTDP